MENTRQIAHDVFMLIQKRLMFSSYVECPCVYHTEAETRVEMHAKHVEFATPRAASVGYLEITFDPKNDSMLIQGLFGVNKKERLHEHVFLLFKDQRLYDTDEKIVDIISSKIGAWLRRCFVTNHQDFLNALSAINPE
jgi:hypothetical protein